MPSEVNHSLKPIKIGDIISFLYTISNNGLQDNEMNIFDVTNRKSFPQAKLRGIFIWKADI